MLGRVRVLEERVWQLEGETRQLESVAGLRDPYSGKRRASRDHLVQQLAQQADTITRLTRQLRLAQVSSFFLPWLLCPSVVCICVLQSLLVLRV